jgi:hypothetical protein
MRKKIIGILICTLFVGTSILPVTGLFFPKETYLSEKITENNTNEAYQKNTMFYTKIQYENTTHEKINGITTNNNFNSTKRDFKKEGIHASPDRFQSLNTLTNRPILWEYSDNYSIPQVSICDNGSHIWVGQGLNDQRFQLFRTMGSGLPEWEYILSKNDTLSLIDSSDEDCILAGVVVTDRWTSPKPILLKWDVSNSTPKWSFDIPDDLYPGALCVSNDGSRIVLGTYNQSQQIIKIFVFNSNSDIPYLIYPINLSTQYFNVFSLDISNDGSIILVGCDLGSFIIDVNVPEVRWSGESPAAISGDGSILVYDSYEGNGHVMNLLNWDSDKNEYVMKWQKVFTPPDWVICINCPILDVSDDGSTVLVGVGNWTDHQQNKVVMFDANSGDFLWEHYSIGLGTFSNWVYCIKLSHNGSKAIVGYCGDGLNTVPVINIFSRESENPLVNIYFLGSAESVDISSDGKFGVAGCKMVHAEQWGCGGVIYAIEAKNLSNNPPDKPETPSGRAKGKVAKEYSCTTSTTDPDGDQVYYRWNWGDGSTSEWFGSYNSGSTCESKHIWSEKGKFNITVEAKDIYGKESSGSDPLPITMPYSYNPISQFLELLFQRFPHAFPILRHLFGY